MSLERLSKQIMVDTQAEAKAILSGAGKKALEITALAEKQAKQLLSDSEKSARKAAVAEKMEALAAARLEAKRVIEEAKEAKADEILSEIRRDFLKQREAGKYAKILQKLVESGLAAIGEKAVVMVNEKDVQAAKHSAKNASVKKTGIAAGAIVTSADEKIIADNSFEAIFWEKSEAIKALLFHKMFGRAGK